MNAMILKVEDLYQSPTAAIVSIICPVCGQSRDVHCYGLRSRAKRGDIFKCHKCANLAKAKAVGQKLHQNAINRGHHRSIMSINCVDCGVEITAIKRNITTNKKRNGGVYRCNACSLKLAHKAGKFNIYDEQFKAKLKKNGSIFWAANRDTWREKLVTPEFRKAMSEYGKRAWTDEYRRRMETLRSTPEFRTKLSNWSKMAWTDKFRARFSKRMKELWDNPEFRDKITQLDRASSHKLWLDADYAYKTLMAIRENWEDPTYREVMVKKMKELWSTAEFRDKIILLTRNISNKLWLDADYVYKTVMAVQAMWNDPIFREKMAQLRLQQPKTSFQQQILYSFLSDLKIQFYDDQSEKCKIGFYTFDCRIDPQDGLFIKKPLLIEVQGDYWHNLPKAVVKDKSKATYIRTYFPEFDLKYVWEHEFNNKDRVADTIKYWLGLNKPNLVEYDFKAIQYRFLEAKEAEIFVSKYHYAGRIGRSGLNIGFFLGDELIAVCIFAQPVRQEVAAKQGLPFKEVLELSRFCIHPAYQKKNLASYLISRSINLVRSFRPEIKRLVSFADSTYNHLGTIYKATNWVLDGEVAPDYWYADDRGYICHKRTLWGKAKQMKMTESEYCDKFHYNKIYGEGKIRYVYDLVQR